MQADEIIAAVDSLEPNQYEHDTKLKWLSDLDGKLFNEIILTHQNPAQRILDRAVADENFVQSYPPYESGSDQLIAGEPYGKDLYCYYLKAMIALHNMESVKYNQQTAAYNNAYREYANHYNRTHYPAQQQGGTRFRF